MENPNTYKRKLKIFIIDKMLSKVVDLENSVGDKM